MSEKVCLGQATISPGRASEAPPCSRAGNGEARPAAVYAPYPTASEHTDEHANELPSNARGGSGADERRRRASLLRANESEGASRRRAARIATGPESDPPEMT